MKLPQLSHSRNRADEFLSSKDRGLELTDDKITASKYFASSSSVEEDPKSSYAIPVRKSKNTVSTGQGKRLHSMENERNNLTQNIVLQPLKK